MLLESEGYRVVGEAASGSEALEAAFRLMPDLVLLDFHLPDMDGIEVAAGLAAQAVPPAVILTSTRDRHELGPLLARSGVLGFVSKAELSGPTLAAALQG